MVTTKKLSQISRNLDGREIQTQAPSTPGDSDEETGNGNETGAEEEEGEEEEEVQDDQVTNQQNVFNL